MRYCTRCVMPETKPDLSFDDQGVCSACRYYAERAAIDWEARLEELREILTFHRRPDRDNYDCIVPVSGGKDSTYQVVRLLQLGMNPLCVTATTCDLSDIGRTNLKNLQHLGVDHLEYTPDPRTRAQLNRIGLERVGDISWPEHVAIFTLPVRAAVQFRVPLIVWGENPQSEYGGPGPAAGNNILDRKWLEEFGGLLGLRVSDLTDLGEIAPHKLIPYTYPSDAELEDVGVTGIFLGHYLPWDGLSNALIAVGHGFRTYDRSVEGSMVTYENLDNHQTGIHDYFKYLKFGFGRATDLACLHLRRGRITRQDAIEIVERLDGAYPTSYLGKRLEEIIEPLGLGVEEFDAICDRFTNHAIFRQDTAGNLVKDRTGRPVLEHPIPR